MNPAKFQEVLLGQMVDAGLSGYTGITLLYHHITEDVMVKWTGLHVDQSIKSAAETILLALIKGSTVDAANDILQSKGDIDVDLETYQGSEPETECKEEFVPNQKAPTDIEVKVETERDAVEESNEIVIGIGECLDEDMDALNDFVGETRNTCASSINGTEGLSASSISGTEGLTHKKPNVSHASSGKAIKITSHKAKMRACNRLKKADATPKGSLASSTPSKQQHLCTICNRSFRLKSLLKAHEEGHAQTMETGLMDQFSYKNAKNTYRLKCDECDELFNNKQSLETHKRTHSEGQLFQCDICYKWFALPTHLQKHKLIHRKESTYQCPKCVKCFFRYKDLKAHVADHNTEGCIFPEFES